MKAVGVIVEYNPFHNGHLYHLTEALKKTEAELAIAVMSGHFLQRGEPALVSKWARTKMALHAGVDLVVELPYAFATQKAETFANGAVSILEALKCDYLCFGSESGDVTSFIKANEGIENENERYQDKIKQLIKTGMSYPSAATLAYQEIMNSKNTLDLSQPNNILGFHYVKAMSQQITMMKPLTIKRTIAGYHEENFTSPSIASATSIRKALFSKEADITSYVPNETFEQLQKYQVDNKVFHSWDNYFDLLKYTIMIMKEEDLRTIYEMEEGLEYRLKKIIRDAHSFQEFMERLKTKRYTWTRLQRLCVHILTRTTKHDMNQVNEDETSPYIRLLGMSTKGQTYLREVKKQLELPLISKISGYQHSLLDLDIKASTAYQMIFPEPLRSKLLKNEFDTPPIRL